MQGCAEAGNGFLLNSFKPPRGLPGWGLLHGLRPGERGGGRGGRRPFDLHGLKLSACSRRCGGQAAPGGVSGGNFTQTTSRPSS